MFDYQWNKWNDFLEHQARDFKLTTTETSVFLTRFAHQNWLEKIEDIWQFAKVTSYESFIRHSTEIYKKFKTSSNGCEDLLERQGAGSFAVLRDWLITKFQESNHFVNRQESDCSIQLPCKAECHQAILQPGALIRIKAPSKMGKTRLLNNILAHGNEQTYRTVHLNLLQLERSKIANLTLFLRWFCVYISDALNLQLNLNDYWSADRGSMLSCTRFMEMVLQQSEQPLVLGLDEADRLLNYPDISQDFFYLLRSWHEEANNDELWEQLRLIVVYSTEDFGNLDINQSPFNVGVPIELRPFGEQQVAELSANYQLNLNSEDINLLQKMLGGHPHLVDLTMSYLAKNNQTTLTKLLEKAAADTSIYNSYLRQHLINLKSNPHLATAFLEILNSPEPVAIDTLLAYQLYRMGLIKWLDSGAIAVSCQLYRQYFLPRLSN